MKMVFETINQDGGHNYRFIDKATLDSDEFITNVAISICPWYQGTKNLQDAKKIWNSLSEKLQNGYKEQAKAAIEVFKLL